MKRPDFSHSSEMAKGKAVGKVCPVPNLMNYKGYLF